MGIPDPDLNAEFTALANRFKDGEMDRAAFDAACKDMLVRHHILLPEPHECEPDLEPSR